MAEDTGVVGTKRLRSDIENGEASGSCLSDVVQTDALLRTPLCR